MNYIEILAFIIVVIFLISCAFLIRFDNTFKDVEINKKSTTNEKNATILWNEIYTNCANFNNQQIVTNLMLKYKLSEDQASLLVYAFKKNSFKKFYDYYKNRHCFNNVFNNQLRSYGSCKKEVL